MEKVSKELLESKIDLSLPPFSGWGNMYVDTSRKELNFTVWNILPNGCGWSRETHHYDATDKLDGHYDVTVNYATFEWSVKQHGTWGNLISCLPPSDPTVWTKENSSESMIKRIESGIARSLMKAAVYTQNGSKRWFIERDECCLSASYTIFPKNIDDEK